MDIHHFVLLIEIKVLIVWYDDEFHNKIGIDGGLALGERGQLNCICLDDDKVFVIKMSEVNHA